MMEQPPPKEALPFCGLATQRALTPAAYISLGCDIAQLHFVSRMEVASPELGAMENIHFFHTDSSVTDMDDRGEIGIDLDALQEADGTWSLVSKEK